MTEDYKKNLLDYATGNLQETSPTTDEIIKEIMEIDRSDWKQGTILPNGWKAFHYEGIIQEKNSGNIILYGGYRDYNSTGIDDKVYGIITLLDNNFKPIKSFFEYDNGTKLRYIQALKQAEDNTFYMIDDSIYTYTKGYDAVLTSQKRFVMLNNFTSNFNGDYSLIMRKSYVFPSGYNTFYCQNLEKNPNNSQYVMVGSFYEDIPNTYYTIGTIELNIPYGESPSWNKKIIGQYSHDNSYVYIYTLASSLITFNEDKFYVKIIGSYQANSKTNPVNIEYHVRYYYKDYNASNYSYKDITTNTSGSTESIQISTNVTKSMESQSVFKNENECYFIMSNLDNSSPATIHLKIQLWYYNISSNTSNIIYSNEYGYGVANHNEQLYLAVNQGKLYIQQIINKGTDPNGYNIGDYYIQRYEGVWSPILVGENKLWFWSIRNIYINNNYNLLKIYLYMVNPSKSYWYFPVAKEIYNPTQYNGEPYVSKDSLCPLYSNLYSNGSLVFSRNLYNISKQNNMSMSSVEIPNSYLNDTTITQNDLVSETNVELVNDPTQWTKNIYEVVDLNFLNTINVIDEDTNTPYLESAIKLNNATTDGGDTNYQNTPCIKYRINYQDSTTSIHNFVWNTIDDTHKETEISLYVDKAIFSIDLLSNDESTIYISIPLNVEVGKYYTINQKIRIGG